MDLAKDLSAFYKAHEEYINEDLDNRFFFGITGDLKKKPDCAFRSVLGRIGNIADALTHLAENDNSYAGLFLEVASRLEKKGYFLAERK